jgi:hypothetical protein
MPTSKIEEKYIVNKIDLCDLEQEPLDEDHARLMNCVVAEAIKRSEKAAQALSDEIDHEITKILARTP